MKMPETGKVIVEDGEYYIVVGDVKQKLEENIAADKSDFAKIAGKEVELVWSEPKPSLVAIKVLDRPPILCYIPRILCYYPAPIDKFKIKEQIRTVLVEEFIDKGILRKELGEKLLK